MKRWLRQNIPRERLSLDLVASDMREMWQSVLSYRHRGCDCAAELWLLAYCSLFCDWKRKLAHDHLSFEVIHLLRSNYCTACFFFKKRNTDIDDIKCFHWEVDKDTHTIYRGGSQKLSCVWETEPQAFLYKFLYILSMLFSKMGRWDLPL